MPPLDAQNWRARVGVWTWPVASVFATWRTEQGAATGIPAQLIAAENGNRTGIVIRNLEAAGGNTLWLGADVGVTPATGFPVPPESTVTLGHQAEIWAVTSGPVVAWALAEEFEA